MPKLKKFLSLNNVIYISSKDLSKANPKTEDDEN